MSGWGGTPPEKSPRCTVCGNSGWVHGPERAPCGSCREGKVAGYLAGQRPAGERVLVRGQHPGEAYETTGPRDALRRWVRLASGNTGWFPVGDVVPVAT